MSKQGLRSLLRIGKRIARLGPDVQCERCGKREIPVPQVVAGRIYCSNCRLILQGKSPFERHHPAGRSNDDFSILIPANDHAVLTDMRNDRVDGSFRNVQDGSMGQMYFWLMGVAEMMSHLVARLGMWADKLSTLNRFMEAHYGRDWEKEVVAWATQNPQEPHS